MCVRKTRTAFRPPNELRRKLLRVMKKLLKSNRAGGEERGEIYYLNYFRSLDNSIKLKLHAKSVNTREAH